LKNLRLIIFVSIKAQAGPKEVLKLTSLCMRPLDMLAPALSIVRVVCLDQTGATGWFANKISKLE